MAMPYGCHPSMARRRAIQAPLLEELEELREGAAPAAELEALEDTEPDQIFEMVGLSLTHEAPAQEQAQ